MADTSMQYADDRNLGARQRFWAASRREPDFDLYRWVLELAGLDRERDADVLDVGCGNGPYEDLLVGGGHRGAVVAIDASLGMLRTLGDGIARVQADAHDLPLADAVVDVALAPHVLYHVADVGRAAAELRRVLRPGGVLVAVTNGADNIRPYVELVEAAVGTGWRMRRPAEEHFSLENGHDQLAAAFEVVERVDAPASAVVVTDVELLAAYVASVADLYAPEVGVAWDRVVEKVRSLAGEEVARDGALRWPTHVGAFLCR